MGNCDTTGYKRGQSGVVGLPRASPEFLELCYVNKQARTHFLEYLLCVEHWVCHVEQDLIFDLVKCMV